ncbi:30S ribosomal protein S17 [bacterium]|nr:30S ribosomal protein S17 [bacterium]
MTSNETRGRRKVRVGEVVSNKMEKTVVIAVTRLVRHPLYGRFVKKTAKYKVHDEKNDCRIGDVVRIMETRPLSKNKRWRLVEIMKRAQ